MVRWDQAKGVLAGLLQPRTITEISWQRLGGRRSVSTQTRPDVVTGAAMNSPQLPNEQPHPLWSHRPRQRRCI